MSSSARNRSTIGALAVAAGVAAYRIPYVRWSAYSHWIGVHRHLLDRGSVALTFDDGPNPDTTPRLLDVLDELDVKATFFVLASEAQQHPDVVRDATDRGHEIGSHGYEHINHRHCSPAHIVRDIGRGRDIIASITGVAPELYRPPFGAAVLPTHMACAARQLTFMLWSTDVYDWEQGVTADVVAERVLDGADGGDILLLHDSHRYFDYDSREPPAIAAVPTIVEGLRSRGLTVGPVGGRMRVL